MKTIEIGIDLGTTNSAVAVVNKGTVEIIKSSLGEETTPSVVFAEKNGSLTVGTKAKRKLLEGGNSDIAQNWKSEVKRLMGTNEKLNFPNYGKPITPEEVSAEILKSLLADVKRRFPEIDPSAAVITVPAHFSTLQSESTKRAGQLAGINGVVLLQEPIAAAVAFGFTVSHDENWLVYDFGGGTFDVALVASRSGALTILAHGGDNFLGGKDIDAAIVDNFIGPFLQKKGHSVDFQGDLSINKKLRAYAEQAKIDLSTSETTSIDISIESKGKVISESLEFSRNILLEASQSILQKTLRICSETIKQSHVEPTTIKRVVLVGGPTQMPILRKYLTENLKIPVDGSQDPLTVVARGAALFAQQTIVASTNKASGSTDKAQSCWTLELNYSPVSSDDQQTVTGKIVKSNNSPKTEPVTIAMQAEDKSFQSGDLILKNGKFITQLPTGIRGTRYWIYLKSQDGTLLDCTPDSISISKGVSISGAPLPHSVGVSILSLSAVKGFSDVEEAMDIFFPRNSLLPLTTMKRFYTVNDVAASDTTNALPIRIYEGESLIPNRNTLICDLEITGKTVSKNLRKGSAVDITISIDESRQLTVKAYIPEVDLTLNARATVYDEDISVDSLATTLNEQTSRNEHISAEKNEKKEITEMVSEIENTLSKSTADSDQRRKASKQIRDLMVAIDSAEARADFGKNVASFVELNEEVQKYISQAKPVDKQPEYSATFAALKGEGMRAIETKDAVILKQVMEKLKRIHIQWMFSDPAVLMSILADAKQHAETSADPKLFNQLVKECETAVENNDLEKLKATIFQILDIGNSSTSGKQTLLKAGITR